MKFPELGREYRPEDCGMFGVSEKSPFSGRPGCLIQFLGHSRRKAGSSNHPWCPCFDGLRCIINQNKMKGLDLDGVWPRARAKIEDLQPAELPSEE